MNNSRAIGLELTRFLLTPAYVITCEHNESTVFLYPTIKLPVNTRALTT